MEPNVGLGHPQASAVFCVDGGGVVCVVSADGFGLSTAVVCQRRRRSVGRVALGAALGTGRAGTDGDAAAAVERG